MESTFRSMFHFILIGWKSEEPTFYILSAFIWFNCEIWMEWKMERIFNAWRLKSWCVYVSIV